MDTHTVEDQIDIVKKLRLFLLDLVKDLSTEQLNQVPAGFNNNIIWNLAHLVAAQQGLCYARAGVPFVVEEKFFHEYKTGSSPAVFIDGPQIAHIKHLMFTTLDQLQADYDKNLFTAYVPWNTRYNVELKDIDSAIEFLLMHEGLHLGYVMALKRAVAP